MSLFEHPDYANHERVLFAHDPATGLRALIAVHSTALGPGAGGCRMWRYDSSTSALADVLRLSQSMSYKNAMAGLDLGGGKSVIMAPATPVADREALFEAFGRAVNDLGGLYWTAEDVGVSPSDMRAARRQTRFVAGLDEGAAASGDPSPITALGIHLGIKVCAARAFGSEALAGRRIAVQGVGSVGGHLCRRLADEGAELVISDVNADLLERVAAQTGARIVAPDAIIEADADIFAPCALGGVINDATIARLRARVVAGGANNQLARPDLGVALKARGVLYAPDYVINAGGIINVSAEISGTYDRAQVEGKIANLAKTLGEVLDVAQAEDRPPHEVADAMARARIAAAKPSNSPS